MRRTTGPVIEVETLADFDRRVALGTRSLAGWHLQSIDLSERSAVLRSLPVAGALFLGCRFAADDEDSVRHRGGIVFPSVPDAPLDTYRGNLYTPRDLYDSPSYPDSLDARAYAWSRQPRDLDLTLAQALHDHAIDDALSAWIESRRLVGVMGGHALARGATGYAHAARLGRLLSATATVATGGGPGAMEAANLGAWLSGRSTEELDHALLMLASEPSFHIGRASCRERVCQ